MATRPENGGPDDHEPQSKDSAHSLWQAAAPIVLFLGLLLLIGTIILIGLVLLVYAIAG